MSSFPNLKNSPDIEMVKNCVVWSLAQGEVARIINVAEFDKLSGAKGVYVQEGVVAVLMVDGNVVSKLSSGVYYFPTVIERFGETLRHIWRFFSGNKANGSSNEDETRRGRLGSELQNLGKNSLIEAFLVIDGYIPIVLGIRQSDFYPYTIQTRRSSINVGLTLNLKVTDFVRFRRNYLTSSPYCRIWDLQSIILDPIGNTLQELFAYEDVEGSIIPPALKAKISEAVIGKINSVLQGVSVAQLIDISINSEDDKRFHELEHRLYCTSNELEYLIRTNDFKNRLIAENNNQRIKDAKSEEDLRYSLNLLNKDRLLHDDEMEAFCQLLASQKKIREAQTDADTDKALLEIKGNRLVSDDEYEELVHELKKKKDARKEVETILYYQTFRRTETEKLNVMRDLARIGAEAAQAQYEATNQQLQNEISLDETATNYTILKDTIITDHTLGKRKKENDAAIAEARDAISLQQEEAMNALANLKAIKEIKLEEKKGYAAIERENTAQHFAHETEVAKIKAANAEAMARITAEMTPDQIAATNIADLSDEAQVALAAAISSKKENEWLQKSAEERIRIIKELADRSAQIDRESREQQERTLDKMMQFMSEAMKTNASVVNGAINGQQAKTKAEMDTIREIATHRIGEVYADKEEAQDEVHRVQSRLDKTQDSALHYTTMTSAAKLQAESVKTMTGGSEFAYYQIPEFGGKTFDFSTVLTMIKEEIVNPDTEIIVNNDRFKANELHEFKKILDRLYGAKCPKCGRRGTKGHLCEECQTMI